MSKRLYFPTAAVTVILAGLILTTSIRTWAAPPTLISDSGKTISTVFEGLKANPQLANYQPLRHPWRGTLQSRLPGLMRTRIVLGNFCPSFTCEGNYAVIVESGGCMSSGCNPVYNFITDTQSGVCGVGAIDMECGGGDAGPCCANWTDCQSPNQTGCHH